MPRLSIVIPCPGGGDQFEDALVSVLQSRPRDCEVLVVYPGVYDDPYELEGEVEFIEAPAKATLPQLINIGLARASGEIVHLLQCGVEVEEDWAETALRCFEDPSVAAVSPMLVCESETGGAVSGVGYTVGGRCILCVAEDGSRGKRSERRWLGPTLAAGFFRKAAVLAVGRLDLRIGEPFADVDLALSLLEAGHRAVYEPACRIFGSPAGRRKREGFAAARSAERLFWKHAARRGWTRSLLSHALLVAAEGLYWLTHPWRITRLCGRASIWLQMTVSTALRRRARVISPPASPPGSAEASRVEGTGNRRASPPGRNPGRTAA